MKFWVKIIVAVCVVVAIAFAVWAFWFKEKDEVQAYNRTSEMIDYKQSLGIKNKLSTLASTDYVQGNPEKKIGNDTETKQKIQEYRNLCLGEGVITIDGGLSYYSYLTMEEYVDDLLEFYLPYTQILCLYKLLS